MIAATNKREFVMPRVLAMTAHLPLPHRETTDWPHGAVANRHVLQGLQQQSTTSFRKWKKIKWTHTDSAAPTSHIPDTSAASPAGHTRKPNTHPAPRRCNVLPAPTDQFNQSRTHKSPFTARNR